VHDTHGREVRARPLACPEVNHAASGGSRLCQEAKHGRSGAVRETGLRRRRFDKPVAEGVFYEATLTRRPFSLFLAEVVMGGYCRSALATALLVGGCWLAIATPAAACGRNSDCPVDGRSYRVVVPAVADAPLGAIIFAHGYRGSAAGSLGNPGLAGLADSLGVVVAAAQATGPEWSVPGVPGDDAVTGVDELAYVEAIADDLTRRFGVDRERIVVSGVSSGAMLV
jgi:hypothetical protein